MSVVSLLSTLKSSGISVRLVDDQLKLNAPKGKLTPELLNELKQHKEQIIEFLRGIFKKGEYTPIKQVEKREYYELSSAQKRLYFIHQMVPDSTPYNMPMIVALSPDPDIHGSKEKLASVFKRLLSRHESFRTSFEMIDGRPVQRIHDKVEFEIEYYELAAEDNSFIRPFDLSKAPLLRVGLVKTRETNYLLMIDMHHIISDGTSHSILENEFLKLLGGQELAPLKLQYKDYSEWQNSSQQKERVKREEPYWLKEFSYELPVLNLPTDYPRPSMQSFEGAGVELELSSRETKILKNMAEERDVTLYMILLAVFNVLFYKLSGQEDIIIGTPIAARSHHDLQYVIGMLANTLAMRNYPSGNKTFRQFLEEVKHRTLIAYENQEYPFEELVEKISVDRDTGRNPVFDVLLNLLNQTDFRQSPLISEESIEQKHVGQHRKTTSRFDMSISCTDLEERIIFNIEYSTRLFKPATIERLFKYLTKIISVLPLAIDQELANIDIISAEEKEQIWEMSHGVEKPAMVHTLARLFEEKAQALPDNTALVFEGQHMSYKELNQRANRLARLLGERGVRPDTVVGVMQERSIDLVAAILAILKAGGAYLPIDTEYPPERVFSMLEDSETALLLTGRKILDRFSLTGLKRMNPDEENLTITPPRPQIMDFDALPYPDRTLIDYTKYHRYIGEAPAKNSITLQATRGCPYNCAFCHKIWPKKHVARSAENIFKEISYSRDAGVRRFAFIDDIFNLDRNNSRRLMEKIVKHRMDIQLFFPNGFRADILTKDFIDLMIEAGAVNIDVALESASPRIQKLIRKNLDLEKFSENVRYIAEKYPHVVLEMEMMIGFPTETEEEALMTLDFLKQLKWVHFPNLHILKIYPNTNMYRLAVENGISKESIYRSVGLGFHQLPETLPFSKSFARQLQAKFMGEYFLLKKRLLSVLPNQMKVLTGGELVQKYDSYLPDEIKCFDDILKYVGISREELGDIPLMQDNDWEAPHYTENMRKYFPVHRSSPGAFRILLLDLSGLFTHEKETMLHLQIEEPLGLLYLMSYLNERFKDRIYGKVARSRVDFDSYEELKTLIFDFKPDLIGIRTLSFYKDFFHKAVLLMRQWGVNVPIIAGGPYATSDYRLILQDPLVDLVILGEGEYTLAELVEKMMENSCKLPGDDVIQNIAGIAFVKNKDKYGVSKKRKREIIVLDELTSLERYSPENPENVNQPGNLVYVIYTSGSTGRPKGVMLDQRNLVNLIRYQYSYTDIDFTRVLQFTTISFDVSAQEIFSTLLQGGTLILVGKETINDIPQLLKLMEKEKIKTTFLPASFLKFVINEDDYAGMFPGSLGHMVTAGEQVILNEAFSQYLKANKVYFHNHYGPTETHVVTALTLTPDSDIPELPSIGRPVTNTAIYILDKGRHLVPVGVAGELMIGGIQVGRGYLNRPELTAERFVPGCYRSYRSYRTYISSKPIYKTGDLARWQPDGNIQFLGRMDHQVKIRGFRVELGEIESQLLNHPEIKEAVVLARNDERKLQYLCAYIVSGKELSSQELRQYLSGNLPDYMIPSYFVKVDKIPLTPNRKVDRSALPEPKLKAGTDYTAPRSETERRMVKIWAEVLGIDSNVIGIDANFFGLGGHSLTATILTAKVHKEFQVKLPLNEVFKNPHIRGLSQYIGELAEDMFTAVEPMEKREYYRLSSAQKRIYILQQMAAGSSVYNMPEIIPLAGEPDMEKLAEIFIKLIRRHESLRTSFHMLREEPVQEIHDEVEFEIELYNLAAGDNSFIRPFDLSKAPLLYVRLSRLNENRYLLLADMHHIISDGVSCNILKKDFTALAEGKTLLPLRIQYKDFSQWQNSEKEKENIRKQETHWLKEFAGEIPVLNIPTDYPGPAVLSFEGDTINFEISSENTTGLNAVALEEKATLYMVLLAVYSVLTAKLSGQEDIIVGTPAAGRRHADLESVIGMFVNTLALRNYPGGEKTFRNFLAEVKERTLAAFENQDYPFEDLVERVSVNRNTSRNPVFDVMFVMQTQLETNRNPEKPAGDMEEENSDASDYQGLRDYMENLHRTAKFDLTLNAVEEHGKLNFVFEYRTCLFKEETIRRFINYFTRIAVRVCENPDQRISDIQFIGEEEKWQMVVDFNATEMPYPHDKTIHQLFEEQAARTPDGVAVSGMGHMTYRELNRKSDQLAHLLKEKGVLADDIAAIKVHRSIEMIIGLLGILKAGGAYLAIDPDYPEERINYMLTDSGAEILLTDLTSSGLSLFSSSLPRLPASQPSNLAYIIYTSGSTGKPKGVLIRHQGVVNMVWFHRKVFGENSRSRISQAASAAFDAMAFEVWPCLLGGACLCMVDNETRTHTQRLKEWLIRHQVTISFQPTLMARELLEEQWVETGAALEILRTAGDRLMGYPTHPYPFRLYNLYGPTEDTVWTTWAEVPVISPSERINPPPIGKPAANKQVYILSRELKLQPVGVVGELCTAGHGLARGYLNNPELTAEKFARAVISHSSLVISSSKSTNDQCPMTNDRLYRTGDLARWLPDGNIEFLGRIDHQVKIRGFRIELGEIENRLLEIEGVREAVVIDREDETKTGEKFLCAYIVSASEIPPQAIKTALYRLLPAYMIPASIARVDRMPLTSSGKVDRKALPAPGFTGEEPYTAPRNKIEEKLVEIWSEVLNINPASLGIDDNFFERGGHSLKAAVMISRLEQIFNIKVPLVEVFRAATPRELGAYIQNKKGQKGIPLIEDEKLVMLRQGTHEGKSFHLFFIHDGTGEVDAYIEFCRNLNIEWNCWGIRARQFQNGNTGPQNITIEALARQYIDTITKVQAMGPYNIAGWSLGGTIAFEMVRQMEKRSEIINFFALIDSPPPPPPREDLHLPINAPEFTLKSELNWALGYLPGDKIKEKMKKQSGVQQLWMTIIDYLKENNVDSEIIKQLIPADMIRGIPNADRPGIRELIRYFNVIRSFDRARILYIPSGKINTLIHYFAAGESGEIRVEDWNYYCSQPVKTYEIDGDHFSIFKKPGVVLFAKKFSETTSESSNTDFEFS
jgi:amino acid adenylation domain-containing protein